MLSLEKGCVRFSVRRRSTKAVSAAILKVQDTKMTEKSARHEKTGPEIANLKLQDLKMQDNVVLIATRKAVDNA